MQSQIIQPPLSSTDQIPFWVYGISAAGCALCFGASHLRPDSTRGGLNLLYGPNAQHSLADSWRSICRVPWAPMASYDSVLKEHKLQALEYEWTRVWWVSWPLLFQSPVAMSSPALSSRMFISLSFRHMVQLHFLVLFLLGVLCDNLASDLWAKVVLWLVVADGMWVKGHFLAGGASVFFPV